MEKKFNYLLECKSNPSFFKTIDPSVVIQNHKVKLTPSEDGTFYLKSKKLQIIETVKELSKRYPEEEFILSHWIGNSFKCIESYLYKKGGLITNNPELNFHYSYPEYLIEIVGEKEFEILMNKIRKFFGALNELLYDEMERNKKSGRNFENSIITIDVSNENCTIRASLYHYFGIQIKAYKKLTTPEISGKLIDKESIKNDNKGENNFDDDDLPF